MQKFYFAAMVYILIVGLAYWVGVAMVPSTFNNLIFDQKMKSIVMHIIAPILGLSTLTYERKRIKISNMSIWSYSLYPFLYFLLLIVPTYVFGYKFLEINSDLPGTTSIPTELSRGIVIYQLVSFNHPLGYPGDIVFIKVILNILLILMSFFTAPIFGFLLRQILRISRPGEEVKKLYFVNPETKYIKNLITWKNEIIKIKNNLNKKSKDTNSKHDNYQKAMQEVQKLRDEYLAKQKDHKK
ncbi:MAGa3780 family membrane protein [Mycoplasmopsis glycophila]|uniref:Uncharacterized protein n=1 Tax=Mycoplasmopsis glycophila TaxID=171285 RepID=A0A449AW12_9BACT|nr:hypothetical protein [Mycoplasmopsis glycophila]VEU70876.1 Uncharacterised protein [Mycoplasmopsis glycophila]